MLTTLNYALTILSALAVLFSAWRLGRDKKNLYLVEITILWIAVLARSVQTLIQG